MRKRLFPVFVVNATQCSQTRAEVQSDAIPCENWRCPVAPDSDAVAQVGAASTVLCRSCHSSILLRRRRKTMTCLPSVAGDAEHWGLCRGSSLLCRDPRFPELRCSSGQNTSADASLPPFDCLSDKDFGCPRPPAREFPPGSPYAHATFSVRLHFLATLILQYAIVNDALGHHPASIISA